MPEFTITRQIDAPVDFSIAAKDEGTELNLHNSYTPNLLDRLLKSSTDK